MCIRECYGTENVSASAASMQRARAAFFDLMKLPQSRLTLKEITDRATAYLAYVDSLQVRFTGRGGKAVEPTEEAFMMRLKLEWANCFVLDTLVAAPSLAAERACILFNVGSLLSYHATAPIERAATTNDKDFYIAQARVFRMAAGVFSGLCEIGTLRSMHEFRDSTLLVRIGL